jgi:hypothetical protein
VRSPIYTSLKLKGKSFKTVMAGFQSSILKTEEMVTVFEFGNKLNPLNAELNTICHLLELLGAHHILHVSRIRVKLVYVKKINYPDT